MAKKQNRRAPKRFKGIRVIPAIAALGQATIWTQATLKVNPFEFLTGVTGLGTPAAGFKPGSDGGDRITLPELLGAGPGGVGGNFGTYAANLPEAVVKNIGGFEGLVMTSLKSVGFGIGVNIFTKLTRKARSGINTQILKPFGVNEFVRF